MGGHSVEGSADAPEMTGGGFEARTETAAELLSGSKSVACELTVAVALNSVPSATAQLTAADSLLGLIRDAVPYEKEPSRREPFYRDDVLLRVTRDRRTGETELKPVKWLEGFTQKDINEDWVKFIFRLLIADGILRPAPDDRYFLVSNRRKVRPLGIPEAFVGGKSAARVLEVPEKTRWLRSSLGFDAEDANSVERILCDAFVQRDDRAARAKRGNKFRKRLKNG